MIMTRTDDAGMADSQVEDLKERVKLINETKPVLAVRSTVNSYPDPSVFGTQVFLLYTFKGGRKCRKGRTGSTSESGTAENREIKANDTVLYAEKRQNLRC